MNNTRGYYTAIVLSIENVLVTGDQDDNVNAVRSTELYNPSTCSWSTIQPMSVA